MKHFFATLLFLIGTIAAGQEPQATPLVPVAAPAAGQQPPATGQQAPAAGQQPQATGQQAPAAGQQPPATGQQAPAAGQPAPAGQTPPAAVPQQQEPPAAVPGPSGARISLHLENANLMQVIGIIAAELKMNYIVDPNVKGVVNINTLGDLRQEDLLPLLQTILRSNGATAVQSGSFWRIVPLRDAPRVPVPITRDPTGASLPQDDRMLMNVVALKYVSAADMSKILGNYLTEAGHIVTHEQGNVLLVTETSRNMRRLMDLINLFDSDALANQRLRVFPVQNLRARDLALDLTEIFKVYAMSEKGAAVRFMPIDRMNALMVVSGNPAVYPEVQQWIEKLDKPVRRAGVQNFVYRVENASVENLAAVLSSLYGTTARTPRRTGTGSPGGPGGAPGAPGAPAAQGSIAPPGAAPPGEAAAATTLEQPTDGSGILQGSVRIVPDIVNNALIIQATAQDYETIRQTIRELDIVPRQVLIETRVYEVVLSGALSFGVEAFLRERSAANRTFVGQFSPNPPTGAPFGTGGISGSFGMLVGRTRELMVFLNAQENRNRTRVLSAPVVLASDNSEARIQVGAEIPILTSQGIAAGSQIGGSSLFANTIQQRDTGVILGVTPRINSSGLVTLKIQQEVSSPGPPPVDGLNSPSIQKRSVNTLVTVQDGETIALGGIIQESRILGRTRVPLLGDIPYLGILFGSTSQSMTKTELIITLTPRVIQDMDDVGDATRELRSTMKELRKMMRESR